MRQPAATTRGNIVGSDCDDDDYNIGDDRLEANRNLNMLCSLINSLRVQVSDVKTLSVSDS